VFVGNDCKFEQIFECFIYWFMFFENNNWQTKLTEKCSSYIFVAKIKFKKNNNNNNYMLLKFLVKVKSVILLLRMASESFHDLYPHLKNYFEGNSFAEIRI
jgi:hypothetical protein